MNYHLCRNVFNVFRLTPSKYTRFIASISSRRYFSKEIHSHSAKNETIENPGDFHSSNFIKTNFTDEHDDDDDGDDYVDDESDDLENLKADLYRGKRTGVTEANILDDSTLTKEEKNKIKLYQRQYEIWKYADAKMPERLRNDDWKMMLKMDDLRDRINFLTYLHEKQRKKSLHKLKRLAEKEEILESQNLKKAAAGDHLIYGQGHNALIRRLQLSRFTPYLNLRALNALVFGPAVVFDMSFLNEMTPREQGLTFKQLKITVDLNRNHRQPAALIFTSFRPDSEWYATGKQRGYLGALEYDSVYLSEKSYLDLFPKQKLIYLSPDSRIPLTKIDAGRVHIVGAFVDKKSRPRLTLGRAKRDGIETRRLPLTDFVKWETGSRFLCLNHVLSILLDVHATDDWVTSIKNNVPARKVTAATPEKIASFKEVRIRGNERIKFLESLIEAT